MANVQDHHHLSQFHFVPWLDANKQVMRWGRVAYTGKLTHQPIAPGGTAYVPNLYARQMVPEDQVQSIENGVFGRLEDRAALVRDKILSSGVANLTPEERMVWAMYINAAAFRTPEALELARSMMPAVFEKALEQFGHFFPGGDTPDQTAKEWFEAHRASDLINAPLDAMVANVAGDQWTLQRIFTLDWDVVDLTTSATLLMLSDRPFLRGAPLQAPETVIAMPIAPKQLFVGCEKRENVARLLTGSPEQVADRFNIMSLVHSKQFAYGDADEAFVDQWLLKQPVVEPA